MNVCIISPEFPPLTNWGGVATFNYNLASMLKRLGHKVFVLTLNPTKRREKQFNRGLHLSFVNFYFDNKIVNYLYFSFPARIIKKILSRYFPNSFPVLEWNLFAFFAFNKLQRSVKIDIIHTPEYSCPALFIKLFRFHPPLIIHSQGPQIIINKFLPYSFDGRLKALIEVAYVKFYPKLVIACSNNIKNFWQKKEVKVPIETIPNFINPNSYRSKICINKKAKMEKGISIFFIGRLEYRKGADILLKAFLKIAQRRSNVKLFFVGNDSQDFKNNGKRVFLKEIIAKIADEKIRKRIEILGWKNDRVSFVESIAKRNQNGIFVLPARYEPFGFVIIEAMVLGLLVIASFEGGAREIIDHNYDGFLIKPKVTKLINILEKVIAQLSQYQNFRLRAKKKVFQKYNFTSAMKSYKQLYKNLSFFNKSY